MLQEYSKDSKCCGSIQNATGASKCYQSIFIFILVFVTQYKPPCISCLLNDQGDGPILCMEFSKRGAF